MNKYFVLIACACITFFSCSKKSSTSTQELPVNVTGVHDLTIKNFADPATSPVLMLTVDPSNSSAVQEQVIVDITGLPDNVTYSHPFGIPPFTSAVYITANGAIPGTYPVTLIVTDGSGSKKRSFPFNLIITGIKDRYAFNSMADVTTTSYGETNTYFHISLLTSPSEGIDLELYHLPFALINNGGFSYHISLTSPYAPLDGTLLLRTFGAAPGTYPITVLLATPTVPSLTTTFNLIVTPGGNYASWHLGSTAFRSLHIDTSGATGRYTLQCDDLNGNGHLSIILPYAPTSETTFRISGNIQPGNTECYIAVSSYSSPSFGSFFSTDSGNYYVTVTPSSSGYALSVPAVFVKDSGGDSLQVSGTMQY